MPTAAFPNYAPAPAKPAKAAPRWVEKNISIVAPPVRQALLEAMKREKMAISEYRDLIWLMAQESGGGAEHFGSAVAQCQGGIRYVRQQYGSALAARRFWKEHHWY